MRAARLYKRFLRWLYGDRCVSAHCVRRGKHQMHRDPYGHEWPSY